MTDDEVVRAGTGVPVRPTGCQGQEQGVLGSSPTGDKCLPPPEEQDQSGSSVHSLVRLELLTQQCWGAWEVLPSLCFWNHTQNATGNHVAVPCDVWKGSTPVFYLLTQRPGEMSWGKPKWETFKTEFNVLFRHHLQNKRVRVLNCSSLVCQ